MWAEQVYFHNKREEKLCGILEYSETKIPQCAFLLLSPHPVLGGDIQNNVILKICEMLRKIDCAFLRFDYHGCGESEIHLLQGNHLFDYYEDLENTQNTVPFYEDVLCAHDYLKGVVHKRNIPLYFIGYSFGGYLSLFYFSEQYPVFAIAPPLNKYQAFSVASKNAYCLLAENDFLSSTYMPQNINYEIAQQADHFFRGKEHLVSEWLLSTLGTWKK